MINILYIAVGEGGSDQALITLIKELENKVNPYVILGKLASQSTIEKLQLENIPYSIFNYYFFWYPTKKNVWNYITRPIYAIKLRNKKKYFARQVIELSRENKIDIIHTNSSAFQFGFAAAQLLKIPHIWHLREYQSLDFGHSHAYSFSYLKKLLRTPGNFNIAITQGIYNFYQLKEKNSTIIYDGVLKQNYKPENHPKEPFFLFVGRIVKEKGIFFLLNSYKNYRQKGGTFKLIFAGNCSSKTKQKIDRLIKKAGIHNYIIFKGALATNQIYDLMNRAMALIVPSPFEAFGLITAEAMFNKCLVIGRDTAGTKEQFDNGQKKQNQEIALRFTNEQQLTTHLISMEQNGPSYYNKTTQQAYDSVSTLYSIENNAKQIKLLYTTVLKNSYSRIKFIRK